MSLLTFPSRALRYWKRNGRYWTLRKAGNALLAHMALRLKLRYVPAMPLVAKLEATNACNGTCVLCPVGQKTPSGRQAGLMRWELFCELVDKLKDTLLVLDITNWGESLIHPRALDMIRYGHQANIYTYLSTNLHTLRDEHVEGLMQCGLDELAISLHGLSAETYAAYQPGYDFAEACRWIERLVDARRRLRPDGKPKIKLNFVVTAVNEHEADQMPAFAARYGVDYVLSEPSLNVRFQITEPMARHTPDQARGLIAALVDRWLPRNDSHGRPLYRRFLEDPALMFSRRKIVRCAWPWTKITFNYDGGLSVCCGSYNARHDLAHYAGQSIRELWNCENYRRSRASFRRRPAPPGQDVLCDHCPGVLL